jgi:hypothetical protein
MPTYLVESYLPQAGARAAASVAARLKSDSGVKYRWSLVLPDEQICLHVLDGPSAKVIREAAAEAELRCQRISCVELISAEQLGLATNEGRQPCAPRAES